MHKKMKLLTITLLSLFACGQMQAMGDDSFDDAMHWDPVWAPPSSSRDTARWENDKEYQKFQQYLDNGALPYVKEEISDDRVDGILRHSRAVAEIHRKNNEDESFAITLHNAALLAGNQIDSDSITQRYEIYKLYLRSFIDDVISKQDILNRIKNMKEDDKIGDLQQCIKDLECCLRAYSKWLTGLRNSGEEHYLFLNYYRNFHGHDRYGSYRDDTPKNRARFGNIIIERELLKKWQEDYTKPFAWCNRNNNANQISMAIIRHQLYKGFEGLDYKKTIEYTGPAICRVKKQG